MNRRKAQIIEQVVAHFKICELRTADENYYSLDCVFASTKRTAHRPSSFGVFATFNNSPCPTVCWFKLGNCVIIFDCLPQIPREI
jgi:hypothetical protein